MTSPTPTPLWEDSRLVEACLAGDERAWEALLQKYKRLIYSVILRYRLQEADAADVFQAVCIDLFEELAKLRHAEAIRGWLARVTANKCFHLKRKDSRYQKSELDDSMPQEGEDSPQLLETAERDQIIHESIVRLSPRCREMLQLLFFEDPPKPYEDVARRLGLATGSIGFIRGRCLKKLEAELEARGL